MPKIKYLLGMSVGILLRKFPKPSATVSKETFWGGGFMIENPKP